MKTSVRMFHWLPRILCILAIFFISLLAADSFSPDRSLGQQLAAFFRHLTPGYILTVLLMVAWKWELPGGIVFMTIGIGLIPLIYLLNYAINQSVLLTLGIILSVNFPFIVVGLLFIISDKLKKKNMDQTRNFESAEASDYEDFNLTFHKE